MTGPAEDNAVQACLVERNLSLDPYPYPMRIPAILTLLACVACNSTPAPTLPVQVETQATRDSASVTAVRAQLETATKAEQFSGADQTHTDLLVGGKGQAFPGAQYAYGFIDSVVGGRRFVGHGGGAAGARRISFEPNGGYVVVVLSNFDPPAAGQVASFILSHLPLTQ